MNLLVLRLATSRLSAAELLTPHRREILCLVLHDLGCLATAFTIGVQAGAWRLRRRDMLIPLALTSTWLLAFPLPLAALSAFAYPAVRRWGAGTLTASTQHARVPAEWAGLLRALKERAREIPWRKRPWGLETTPLAGAVQTRFLTLCRIKAFLLFFDGALIFFLAWKIAHTTTLATALSVLFLYFSFLFAVLLSGLAGVAASWIEDGRRLIRTGAFLGNDGEPQPYGRSLMINAGACVSGGILGYGIGTGNGFLFGGWLMLIGFMGSFHVVPPAYRLKGAGVTYGQALRTLVLRVLLFIAIFLLGTVAFKGGKPAGTLAGWFTTLSVLAPAWALITGFFLRNRLLEPFRARDAMSPHLPWLCRWTLAVFLLTLILPLGGLTIPLWIWARARLWPVWERDLLHEVPSQ